MCLVALDCLASSVLLMYALVCIFFDRISSWTFEKPAIGVYEYLLLPMKCYAVTPADASSALVAVSASEWHP